MVNGIATEIDSIEDAVKIINSGGINGISPVRVAGEYACQRTFQYEDVLDDGFLAAILDELKEMGAEFDYAAAMDCARSIKGMQPAAYTLEEYIRINFGYQKSFALHQNVQPPQVTQWIEKNYIVVDDVLYSPRRNLQMITPDEL